MNETKWPSANTFHRFMWLLYVQMVSIFWTIVLNFIFIRPYILSGKFILWKNWENEEFTYTLT